MSEPTGTQRVEAIERLSSDRLDVLVVGGGIVGTGVARDAAMRGLRVGLVDQHDFAFGTSSRSSRLLHGGLRYLAQGHIGLVREASIEKRIVHGLAPHICAPLPFVLPTYRGAPWAPWALWKLHIGVRIYDWLCSGRNFGESSSLGPDEVVDYLRGVREPGLTGAVRYYDGLTSDARLTIDTLRSAAKAGADVVNYCKMEEAVNESGWWRCRLTDRAGDREIKVFSRCVVNATGPWGQQFAQSSIPLRLTKGIHLVIDRSRLPVPDAVVMAEGRRILFAIPWGERVILGTTDTDYAGSPDEVFADPGDIDYVLRVVNEAFPRASLDEKDIISTWAGLRPLIANSHGEPSDVTRSHVIRISEPGWYNVAGGKLTTYRLMAEQTVNRIERFLGRRRTPCNTATVPLLEPQEVEGFSAILPPQVSPGVVEHYCLREWAIHLDDVMIRRTGWHYYRHEAGAVADQVAAWMAELLGWSEDRRVAEIERYRRRAGLTDRQVSDRPRPSQAGAPT